MQFSIRKIFYKSIGDIKIKIFLSRGKLKGEKMTEVKRIDGIQASQPSAATNPVKKVEAEKEKLNEEIKKLLLGDKKAQEARKAELNNMYTTELNLGKKDAKKAAQNRLDDEIAGERIDNTNVFYDKSEYEKLKEERDNQYKDLYKQYRSEGKSRKEAKRLANADAGEVTYIKSKKVRNFIDAHKDKFINEDGTFNQDKYKEEIKKWTGDNKLDLSESRAAGKEFQVKAKTIRKAADYANFDVQKDKTAAKRALHVGETTLIGTGIGAAVGAIAGKHIKKSASGSASDLSGKTIKVPFEGGYVDVAASTIINATGSYKQAIGPKAGSLLGAISGGAGGLGAGLATMHKIKDQGEKDVFNGISAEEVVKEGAKGIDGEANAKIVNGILRMENLTDEQKVELFKKHYGENTGKRVTQRELLAAYNEAKQLNEKPQTPAQTTTQQNQGNQQNTPVVTTPQNNGENNNQQPANTTPAQPQPGQQTPAPAPEKEPCEVIVQNGESIAKLAKKYGVSQKEIIELNRSQLKKFKNAKNCDDNKVIYGFLVGAKIRVPEGCDKADKNKSAEDAIKDYNRMVEKHIDEYCEDHGVYSKEFKKQIEAKKSQKAA